MLALSTDTGSSLVEYSFILLFVGLVMILIVAVLGTQVGDMYSEVTSGFITAG